MKTLLAAAALVAVASSSWAAESDGTVTIPVKEYEALKKAVEELDTKNYWNMTFQQILEKEKGKVDEAWELYEYYVLRTLYLDGQVSAGAVDKLIGDIRVLGEIDGAKPITMVINSPGGSVFDGLSLYNAMMASAAPVNTVCDGIALSMAAVLLSVGHHRTARDGCVFMVHEAGGGSVSGQTTQQIKTADFYISIENVLLQILSENSGLSIADVRRVGEFESFYNAEETRALGFVDEVVGGKPRQMPAGSRAIPDDLHPRKRIARQISERMAD